MQRREMWRFLAVTFALGLAAQFVAIQQGLHGSGQAWLKLAMWAPAVGAMTSAAARRAALSALRRSGGRCLWVAVAVGWSLTLNQSALLAMFGGGAWNERLFLLDPSGRGIAEVRVVAMVLGVGPQGFAFFALNLLVSLTLGSMVVAAFGGLGEELGWRAVLQPALERRLGPVRGSLLVGIIWAYWHLPLNLAGYNDATHPVWNALLLFPLAVIAMAYSFGWLARRTGSVWPAAFAHGANNCISAGFLLVPRSWGWDAATMLLSVAVVGGLFGLLSREAKPRDSRRRALSHEGSSLGIPAAD